MFSIEELSKSVYYPACGNDLRAIFAFSHICKLFIYVDWMLEVKCIKTQLEEDQNNLLEIAQEKNVDVTDVVRPKPPDDFMMLPEEREAYGNDMQKNWQHIHPLLALDIPENPGQEHEMFLHPAHIVELILRRRINGYERKVRLLYVPGDALGAYCFFYRGGLIAPLALVTTDTGMMGNIHLEEPNGIMARLLRSCKQKPLLWVRSTGLCRDERFYSTPVQKYCCWPGNTVTAYKCAGINIGLRNRVTFNGIRSATLQYGYLEPRDFGRADVIFLTGRQYQDRAYRLNNVVCYPENPRPFRTLSETLDYIDRYCTENDLRRAIAIPRGYEDEGVIIRDWVQRGGLPEQLEIYFDGEFDFADLRKPL